MSQNHFTLGFPLKSPADAKALSEQLPPLMPELFQAQDADRHDSLLPLHGLSERPCSSSATSMASSLSSWPIWPRLAGPRLRRNLPACKQTRPPLRWPPIPRPLSNGPQSIFSPAVNLYTAYPGVTAKEDQGPGIGRRRYRCG